LGMTLFDRGEMARGGGWMERANRVLEEAQQDCVERGYLLVPMALQAMDQGDAQSAFATFEEADVIAERFGDPQLRAMSRLGRGQALVLLGETSKGAAWLDEVMVTITTEDLSPIFTGIAYCAVIDACLQIFDLRRAHEWTAALSRWSNGQPDMVPFRGQCLVHRAEILQLHGSWPEAVGEAQRACDLLSGRLGAGAAFYQLAELFRLLGQFSPAERAYRQAGQLGHAPQPGVALLRLAQGQTEAAAAAIRREIDEAKAPLARARLLPAYAEIVLSTGDRATARKAADELAQFAGDLDAPYLRAVSAQTTGAVLLAEGDPRAALASLRTAWAAWHDLDAPYEAARTRVLIGLACRELADEDSARMELDGARQTFEELGAVPDIAKVLKLLPSDARRSSDGLTAREVQVLGLVAAGKSNRAIAKELVISEKTVARHVSNIFTKLGLSSRAAATAYAYQHGLA
jgi:DNA-binding CsgD family transcriptional regulator